MDEERVEWLLAELVRELEAMNFNGKRLLLWFLRVYYDHILLRGY